MDMTRCGVESKGGDGGGGDTSGGLEEEKQEEGKAGGRGVDGVQEHWPSGAMQEEARAEDERSESGRHVRYLDGWAFQRKRRGSTGQRWQPMGCWRWGKLLVQLRPRFSSLSPSKSGAILAITISRFCLATMTLPTAHWVVLRTNS